MILRCYICASAHRPLELPHHHVALEAVMGPAARGTTDNRMQRRIFALVNETRRRRGRPWRRRRHGRRAGRTWQRAGGRCRAQTRLLSQVRNRRSTKQRTRDIGLHDLLLFFPLLYSNPAKQLQPSAYLPHPRSDRLILPRVGIMKTVSSTSSSLIVQPVVATKTYERDNINS